MEPLISILIPAYNAEAWLAGAINSVTGQTWQRKEIIVVDDGSTDDTLAVARRFAGPEVSILSQEQSGASAARNKAFRACQGDYIQWLDADDLLAPEKLAAQMQCVAENESQKFIASSAWARFYHRPEKAGFTPSALWQDLSPTEWLILKMRENLWMPTQSWLIRRDLAVLAGQWDESLSYDDDGEYFSRVIARSETVHFVRSARSYVRRGNAGSLSGEYNLSPAKLESQLRSMTLQIGYLRELADTRDTRAAALTYLQNWFPYFYPEESRMVATMRALAADLGGELTIPEPTRKYRLLFRISGWRGIKRTRRIVSRFKSRLFIYLDKLLSHGFRA